LGYLYKHEEKDKYVFLKSAANWGWWEPKMEKIRKIPLEWQTENSSRLWRNSSVNRKAYISMRCCMRWNIRWY